MRLSVSFLFVSIFCIAVADTASSGDDSAYRTQVLHDQFYCDPGTLHHRLENYFQAGSAVSDWATRAETGLSDWFRTSENNGDVDVTCVADLCAVDFRVSFHEFATTYRSMVEEWEQAKHAGFLKDSFSFPRGDGSTRLFVFRDSFDPANLPDRPCE